MKVKLILPSLAEASSPNWRPIKYSLFPPLGLVTLAGYLDETDEVDIQDEHVETLDLDDQPDLVAIQAYVTSARRAYRIADHYRRRGVHVCLGTSPACRARRPSMPTRSSSARARTPGRGSWLTSAKAVPGASTAPPTAACRACRRSAEI